MKIRALLAAAAIGVLAFATTTPARANSAGPAIAAGIGGFALGAIAGGALARPAPPPVVYYDAPPPPPPPRCWVERRPIFDEYGVEIGSRPRRICE